MTRAYISGPMTGVDGYNREAFFDAADELETKGYTVLNPADEDYDFADDHPDDPELVRAHYLRKDMAMLAEADVVFVLPGWRESKGAVWEVDRARELMLPILDYLSGKEVELEGSPRYLQLLEDARRLHMAKAAGYSGAGVDHWQNFRESENWGVPALTGCLVRMGDKYRRCQNLLRDPSNDRVGEALSDTLMDLSAYALIARCLYEEARLTDPQSADDGYPEGSTS